MSASDTALAAANARYGAGWSVSSIMGVAVITAVNQEDYVQPLQPSCGILTRVTSKPSSIKTADFSNVLDAYPPIGSTVVAMERSYDEAKTAWVLPSGEVWFIEDCVVAGGAAVTGGPGGIIGLLLVGGLLWLVFKS